MDLGLELAGFGTRAAVELEPYACETLRRNRDQRHRLSPGVRYLHECEVIEADIRKVSGAALMRAARVRKGETALLAGGPPCITFSVAGRRRGLADETGRLFEEYVRLLRAVRPAALLFENVKGLLSAPDEAGCKGGAFRRVHDSLAAEGYSLSWRVVNMADYGVPQTRERVIILGTRQSPAPEFPAPTHRDPEALVPLDADLKPWADVESALRGMPPAAPPGEKPAIANHVSRRHGPAVIESFAATPPGRRNPKYKRDRLRWDRPAKVIRAQGKLKPDGSGQKNSSHQAIHPDAHRQLTVRECARIQTFPDWYWLPETFVNGYRIIGDAVPPAFARIAGESIRRRLELVDHPARAAA